MKKSTRALIGMLVLDLLVAGGASYMVWQIKIGALETFDEAEAISTIMSTAGWVIGVVTAVLSLAFVVHRKNAN